ncbi:MAG: V-type ATP synthase subunit B, partial [Treponema sp.]|nr:V-type ATP synthase subunit B [Treponema sp.]
MRGIEYKGLTKIEGPLVITSHCKNVGFNEMVFVYDRDNNKKLGRVLDISEDLAAVQIFGNSTGLSAEDSRVEFLDKPMELRVGSGLLGRVFNGLGNPADGYGEIFSSKTYDINGLPINPYARTYPRDFIQTGISSIDGMNTLIRGQKLPIFSGNGLPHNRLAAQIVRQAKILREDEQFVIVFCAMGINNDVARFFIDDFEHSGVLAKTCVFLSLADSPSLERLIAPRCALTAAEFLAFEMNMHVLVVMTDMTNYCEALREVSSIRGEVP